MAIKFRQLLTKTDNSIMATSGCRSVAQVGETTFEWKLDGVSALMSQPCGWEIKSSAFKVKYDKEKRKISNTIQSIVISVIWFPNIGFIKSLFRRNSTVYCNTIYS